PRRPAASKGRSRWDRLRNTSEADLPAQACLSSSELTPAGLGSSPVPAPLHLLPPRQRRSCPRGHPDPQSVTWIFATNSFRLRLCSASFTSSQRNPRYCEKVVGRSILTSVFIYFLQADSIKHFFNRPQEIPPRNVEDQ